MRHNLATRLCGVSASSWRCALLGVFALFAVFAQLRFRRENQPTTPCSPTSAGWRTATSSASPASRSARSTTSRSKTTPPRWSSSPPTIGGADRGHQGGHPLRRPDRRPLPGPGGRRRRHHEAQPGRHDPAGPHRAALDLDALIGGFRPLFSRAGPRPGQRVDRPADRGVPGPGRHHRLVPDPDRGADQHAGRPRPADRPGDHQSQHGAGLAGRPERPVRQSSRLARPNWCTGWRLARTTSATAWPTPTPPQAPSPTCLHRRARRCRRSSHETDRTAGIVVADHDYFDNLLNTLPDAYQALGPARPQRRLLQLLSVRHGAEAQRQGRPTGVRQDGRPELGKVHAAMKPFPERNPFIIGAIGLALTARHRGGRACSTTSCRS